MHKVQWYQYSRYHGFSTRILVPKDLVSGRLCYRKEVCNSFFQNHNVSLHPLQVMSELCSADRCKLVYCVTTRDSGRPGWTRTATMTMDVHLVTSTHMSRTSPGHIGFSRIIIFDGRTPCKLKQLTLRCLQPFDNKILSLHIRRAHGI